jgi:3-dehydroquinate synthase
LYAELNTDFLRPGACFGGTEPVGCNVLILAGQCYKKVYSPDGEALPKIHDFTFGGFTTRLEITDTLKSAQADLVVCDANTRGYAEKLDAGKPLVLESGEENKGWDAARAILSEAHKRGLGRDSVFAGVGGGVICDLTAFAASVYMRGARLALYPTTLLAMADASLGGKTGFDFEGVKNLVGSFYPAEKATAALETLRTLPEREWKSGMAEIIKAAVLAGDEEMLDELAAPFGPADSGKLERLLEKAIVIKANIVSADPRETEAACGANRPTGANRALLNLGHTFGHALEAAAGLGNISHGEAVAWGMYRACELGTERGITPPERAARITGALKTWGYADDIPYNKPMYEKTINDDKKKKNGALRFVVPNATGACLITA